MKEKNKKYPLDNAASIFPSIINERTTVVFSISFTLKSEIDREKLQEALNLTILDFPYFQVRLRWNFFHYYLQEFEGVPVVDISRNEPCRSFSYERDGDFLFRIRMSGRSITLEMSHLLTDGTGALIFLKALTVKYITLSKGSPNLSVIFQNTGISVPDETLCPYKYHYNENSPSHPFFKSAYRIPGELIDKKLYRIDRRSVSLKSVKEHASKLDVSITEYLAAVYIAALQRLYASVDMSRKNSPVIRVEVPVNLRAFFPMESLRNFTLFVLPEHDMRSGILPFYDIAFQTHHQIRLQTRPAELVKMLSRNVRGEYHPLVRWMPRVLRDGILKVAYSKLGENQFSGLISNLGKIEMPHHLAEQIEEINFIAAPSSVLKTQCGIVSWNDRLIVNFGSLNIRDDLEKLFFEILSEEGHDVERLSPQ